MNFSIAFGLIGHIPDAGWTNNGGTTNPLDTTGATFIGIGATYLGPGGVVFVSDSFGNTIIPLIEKSSTSGGASEVRSRIWYINNPIVGPGHTFTFNSNLLLPQAVVFGFSGNDPNPFNSESGNGTGSGTFIQPGPITPASRSSLSITVASFIGNTAFDLSGGGGNLGGGFNVMFNVAGLPGQRITIGYAIKIKNNDISVDNPTWSWIGSAGAAVTMANFKASPDPDFTFSVDAKRV